MFADPLKILRGQDIKISDSVTLHQPTINEIEEYGELKFFSVFSTLCAVSSDLKSELWDKGIDWTTLDDFELFFMLSRTYTPSDTAIIIPGIDLSKLEPMIDKNNDMLLVSHDDNIIISSGDYQIMIEYIREFLGIQPKVEKKIHDKYTKMALLEDDRRKKRSQIGKPYKPLLLPMIVTLVNTEEFSYDYTTVFDITINQLTKSYIQIQKKKQANALMQGSLSGFIDTSKIKVADLNWCYEDKTP